MVFHHKINISHGVTFHCRYRPALRREKTFRAYIYAFGDLWDFLDKIGVITLHMTMWLSGWSGAGWSFCVWAAGRFLQLRDIKLNDRYWPFSAFPIAAGEGQLSALKLPSEFPDTEKNEKNGRIACCSAA